MQLCIYKELLVNGSWRDLDMMTQKANKQCFFVLVTSTKGGYVLA